MTHKSEPSPLPHNRNAVKLEPAVQVPQLLSRCLGNRDLAKKLIERFQASVGDLHNNLEKALSELQFEAASLLAHRLKGEAANLGAIAIKDNATTIEETCRERHLPHAAGALAELKHNYKLLQEQLPVLIQSVATCEPDPKLSCLPKRQPR